MLKRAAPPADGVRTVPACCRMPDGRTLVSRAAVAGQVAACDGLIWLHGPAGMGKTSLAVAVAGSIDLPVLWYELTPDAVDPALLFATLGCSATAYLDPALLPPFTPEYHANLTAFAARYFQAIGSYLGPVLLVFDNAEVLDEADFFPAVLAAALTHLPVESKIVVTSRSQSPAILARERARGRCHVFGHEVLAFSEEEATALLHAHRGAMPEETAKSLVATADGWPALLVLLAQSKGGQGSRLPGEDLTLLSYLEEEVFESLDQATRHVLLSCAYCAEVDDELAVGLSDSPSAPAVLAGLADRGMLAMRQGGVFRLHPLLQDYLRARAGRELEAAARTALMRQTAELLVEQNRHNQAVPLLAETGHWRQLTDLVLSQAPVMFTQSRVSTLLRWLRTVPEAHRREQPWLLFWEAQCILSTEPVAARGLLEAAYAAFPAAGDVTAQLTAWTAAIDTFWWEWSSFADVQPWLDRLADPALLDTVDPMTGGRAAVNMFMTLAMCRLDDPQLAEWERRALAFLQEDSDSPMHYLLCISALGYYSTVGSQARARLLFDRLAWLAEAEDAAPALRLNWQLAEGVYRATYDPSPEAAVGAFRKGIAIGQETGIGFLNFQLHVYAAFALLGDGEPDQARRLLDAAAEQMQFARPIEREVYLLARSWLALYQGMPENALEFAEQALAAAERAQASYIVAKALVVAAHAATACGRRRLAARYLGRANRIRRGGTNPELDFILGLEGAWAALCGNHPGPAKRLLAAALASGRQAGCRQFIAAFTSAEWAQLLAAACEWGIETEYVRMLIGAKRLAPPASQPEHWPWPLRIHTLGAFQVYRGAELLTGGGRPADLLKALLADGGVQVRQERLADLLWPDAEGDAARAAFDTTLSRLRRWLGVKDALLLHDGRLSLNRQLCWVDAEAFEQRARAALNQASARPAVTGEAARLYRGEFLAGEAHFWAMPVRARLAGLFAALEGPAADPPPEA